jgi:hypothetical protein
MKRTHIVLLTGLLAVLAFGLSSCASGPGIEKPASDIPAFYLNPPQADDAFYGVGSARMSKLDTSRSLAIARARNDIAFQMQASIKAAITDYAQESGADGKKQTLEFVETVSKQIAETTLKGSKVEQVVAGKDGTIYALVSYPLAAFKDAANKEFARNQDAAFAEFKASQALDKLDYELKNNPTKGGTQNDKQ